jgi:hypothetical protein
VTTAIVLLGLLCQAGAPASGESDAKAKAQALLTEGAALYAQGNYAEALFKFGAAYAIFPSPKLQFNIAQADRELGRTVEAIEAFETFLAQVPDAAPELASEAHQAVADLRAKLGRLNIHCPTPDSEVVVDGRLAGNTPLAQPIWVTPGRHKVVIRHEGYSPLNVTVAAGEDRSVVFEPSRNPIAPTKANGATVPSTNDAASPEISVSHRPIGYSEVEVDAEQPGLHKRSRSEISIVQPIVPGGQPATRWYGGTAVGIDSAALGLIALTVATKSPAPAVIGVLAYPFSGMVVHAIHRRGAQAVLSVLLRLSAVALGATLDVECTSPSGKSTACEVFGIGALVTLPVAAMVVDDFFLAREPASADSTSHASLAPALVIEPRVALFRLGGMF